MDSMVYLSGAAGGLGRSMAVECAQRGWDLFLTDIAEDGLERFAGALRRAYGVRVEHWACDMASYASRTALLEHIEQRGYRFRMAVNIAGVDHEGLFLEKSREQIQEILQINVLSTLDMTHALIGHRDPSLPFRILNVCSLAGMFPMPVKATYAASKRLLIDMSLALREEFRPLNATVTALCPAGMATNDVLLKSLDVQGFAGRVTTLEVPLITRRAIDCALRGKAVYVPGAVNKALLAVSRLAPVGLKTRAIAWRWRKTNRQFEKALCEPASQS